MTPEYIEANRWLKLPFIWGQSDCILVLGDWIQQQRRADPFAGDRMTYDSAASCQRVTGFFTAPVAVLESRFAKIGGLPRVDVPCAGDVAVLALPGHQHPSGGLFMGDCWALKSPDGVLTMQPEAVEPLAIWKVRDDHR